MVVGARYLHAALEFFNDWTCEDDLAHLPTVEEPSRRQTNTHGPRADAIDGPAEKPWDRLRPAQPGGRTLVL
jgi:hypothetical protein